MDASNAVGHVRVVSWNLLAHEFTGHEAKNHCNKTAGTDAPREHIDQFADRCERARRIILDQDAALVLLQEVSFSFLNDASHGGMCHRSDTLDQLYERYRVIPAFGDSGRGANEPGMRNSFENCGSCFLP